MIEDDNKTIWCGNISEHVTEEMLYELFLQAGPLENVNIAKDRDGRQKCFAFIKYRHEVSVPYAISLFRGTSLFHRTLTLQTKSRTFIHPPAIRCNVPEMSSDFKEHGSLSKQFVDMTDKLQEDKPKHLDQHQHLPPIENPTHGPSHKQEAKDKLILASLQGNWSHRHHPYKSKEKAYGRDEYRRRDHDNYKTQNNQRNRRNFRPRWRD